MIDKLTDGIEDDFDVADMKMHPLPPYNTYQFIVEHSTIFAVVVAVVSIIVSTILWRYIKSREKEQFDSTDPRGMHCGAFNTSVLSNLRRRASPISTANTTSYSNHRSKLMDGNEHGSDSSDESVEKEDKMSGSMKKKGSSVDKRGTFGNKDVLSEGNEQLDNDDAYLKGGIEEVDDEGEAESLLAASSGSNSCTTKLSVSDCKKINLVGALGKLHGKLATAELRARASRMKKEMTEMQRDEEREVQRKQLEEIYALMMADAEKFGVQDKSELVEQLKLYSI